MPRKSHTGKWQNTRNSHQLLLLVTSPGSDACKGVSFFSARRKHQTIYSLGTSGSTPGSMVDNARMVVTGLAVLEATPTGMALVMKSLMGMEVSAESGTERRALFPDLHFISILTLLGREKKPAILNKIQCDFFSNRMRAFREGNDLLKVAPP